MSAKEIERPLGQDRGLQKKPARRPAIGKGRIAAICGGLAIVAVSTVIALREDAIRQPQPIVVAATEIDASPERNATAQQASPRPSVKTEYKPGGPAITKVGAPDSQSTGAIVVSDPSAFARNLRTAHLPDLALLEDSPKGKLPVRSADGRRPFDVYARPWSGARGARVAIVVGGLGVSQTGTQQAIAKLPPEVTLAFASQGNSISRWMQEARRQGHEILMQVPLEPFDYPNVNPGRGTLTVEGTPEENIENLQWVLGRTTNYTGVMNYMGARFVADAQAVAPMMAELGRRGLLFLDDGSTARSTAPDEAIRNGVPVATGDAVIDDEQERGAILKKLDQLEATARAKGFAIGTGSAFDVTVDAVASWVNEAKKRGIEIVPVSAVATDPEKS